MLGFEPLQETNTKTGAEPYVDAAYGGDMTEGG